MRTVKKTRAVRRRLRVLLSWSAVAAMLWSGATAWAAPILGYRVVATLPHATGSYTEGFLFLNGLFYEGTGMEGRSALMAIVPETGRVLRSTSLPAPYFGEGIVDWGPYLYEWTWTSHRCFVYDRRTFQKIREFSYSGEGWGMTRTRREILTSDGTESLTFRDPKTFQPVRSITVHDGPMLISQLNELEYIKDEIYANLWHSERIARISPLDGHVLAYIDLRGLRPAETLGNAEAVLNGIAYDAAKDRLYVTGKQWPSIFQIQVEGQHVRAAGR